MNLSTKIGIIGTGTGLITIGQELLKLGETYKTIAGIVCTVIGGMLIAVSIAWIIRQEVKNAVKEALSED